MTVILLCGGYATRLYPLNKGGPKSLIEVNGHTLLDRILNGIPPEEVKDILLVTSKRFVNTFNKWWSKSPNGKRVTIICDMTENDTDKLGAVADIGLVLRQWGVNDDVIVIAPDNLFTEPVCTFIAAVRGRSIPAVCTYDVGDLEKAKNYGVVSPCTDDRRFVVIEEKPASPQGTTVAVGLYYFPQNWLIQIHAYLSDGGKPDCPGHLMEWLCKFSMMHVFPLPGLWFDIGSKEALDEAKRKVQ